MGQLTEGKLKKLVKAAAPIPGVSDGDGLTFTMSEAQAKRGHGSWVFRYRHAGKQREITLGNYPDMPLDADIPSSTSPAGTMLRGESSVGQ